MQSKVDVERVDAGHHFGNKEGQESSITMNRDITDYSELPSVIDEYSQLEKADESLRAELEENEPLTKF